MPQSVLAEPYARVLPAPSWENLNHFTNPQSNVSILFPHKESKTERPKSLTIRFSRAADLEQVVDLYSGDRKRTIDPKNFIRPRSYEELAGPVRSGAAALAIDEKGDIRASALASIYDDGNGGKNNITEVGAVICDVGGVGLSKIIIAMLGLKQTFDPRAGDRVYAKVARDNVASNKIFASSLDWDTVTCPKEAGALYDIAYRGKTDQGRRDRLWYHFNDTAQGTASNIIQSCVDQEALKAKDGSAIALNIEASSLWSTLHFYNMLSMN